MEQRSDLTLELTEAGTENYISYAGEQSARLRGKIQESCSRCEGFRNERDCARRKNQTLEKEIQVLKTKSEDYQRINQELQKSLESVKEEQRNLQLLSENLEAAKKEQEEKIGQLKRKNEEPENKVTKNTSEFEKILASEQKLRKILDCLEKSLADFKAKNVELENMSEENKPLHEESNAERSKCDDLTTEIRRLNLRLSPKKAGRKCFV